MVTVPIGLAILFLMGVGPALPWRRTSAERMKREFWIPSVVGVVTAAVSWLAGVESIYPILTFAFAGFVMTTIVEEFRKGVSARRRIAGVSIPTGLLQLFQRNNRRYGGYVVHTGIVVIIVALAASGTWRFEKERTLQRGESLQIGDYQVQPRTHPHDDMMVLRNIAQVAAASFCPFIAAASPAMFGVDDWTGIEPKFDLAKAFDQPEFIKWNAIRDSEDSRFLGLTLPNVLMRLPHVDDNANVDGFQFMEDVSGPGRGKYLWGNAAFALGEVLIRTFAQSGWLGTIRGVERGVEGGGLVTRLPTHHFGTDRLGVVPKTSTDVIITDELEKSLSDLGFIPLCHCYDTPYSAFYSNQSVQKAKVYDSTPVTMNARMSSMLQYMLCVSRFSHYIKVIVRDRIGGFHTPQDVERQLNLLSQRDGVTGLYNRQHFMTLLQQALSAAESGQYQSGLLELVLDDYARVKENVGVLGADQVVAEIAGALQGAVGERDSIARLDGSTFAILTPTADSDALEQVGRRARQTVKDHVCTVGKTSVSVTATIGVARIDGSTSDPNDILSRAERALGEAMDKGGDAQRIYQPREGELSQKQIDQQWVDRIKGVLQNDQLSLLYQPIVSLTDDTTARYEVLPRILDDHGQPQDNPEMIAAAERTGMSKGIDRWVLLNSLKALVEQSRRDRSTTFFVPLSAQAFEDPGLFRWIHERIKKLNLSKGRLVFQMDAGSASTRIKQASAFATAAHKIGCGIALSGFGRGSDPFQITRHVDVDFLRISEEFMDNLGDNERNQEAIQQITEQARQADKRTICPAVADAGTLTVLWGLGPDLIEGEFLQEASAERQYDFTSMAM